MRVLGFLIAAVLLGGVWAQSPPAKQPEQQKQVPDTPTIRVDVPLVNVPFSVLDQKDRLVTDLKKEDFTVYEDGKKVDIRFFSPITRVPLRIGLLLDTSNSVRLYFKAQQNAAIDFVHSMLEANPKNRILLMTFDFTKDILSEFSNDADHLATLIRKLKPGGGTALYDAVYMASKEKLQYEAETGGLRRVLVLATDGEDDASKHSMDEAIAMARRAGVTIYAIATISFGYNSPGEKILEKMAEETGGRVVYPWKKPPSAEYATGYISRTQIDGQNAVYEAGSGKYSSEQAEKLEEAIGLIQRELQTQYSLAYVPPNPAADGRYREIRVEVAYKGLKIRGRRGYYPPQYD